MPETPLSSDGFAQAKKLAERVKRVYDLRRIITSDLQRAVDTAKCLQEVFLHAEFSFDEGLRERDLGNHRGRSYASLREANIDVFDPTNPTVEKVEPFQNRVNKAWERIASAAAKVGENEAIAFVTHGLVLRHIFTDKLEVTGADQPIHNTSITVLDSQSFKVVDGVLNCAKHLGPEAKANVVKKAMI